jgi:hypothetical protein
MDVSETDEDLAYCENEDEFEFPAKDDDKLKEA